VVYLRALFLLDARAVDAVDGDNGKFVFLHRIVRNIVLGET
jgi:hypothetical protein